ncbi:hypothetical protein BLNAU_10537 [Blattamonas nauphoetae]|uniref:Uncharacterized protein n=1 Tax=Blattamonas nauphoetae TaxID=2049346 RepID=A0ABQ9XQ17_9EUKA|nr:hypothetical protein BLNAU_10537 [Blattamonas nauphoetae]
MPKENPPSYSTVLPPMNPVTPDISHFASEIVKKEFAMAELDYAQSIVNIVQDAQPGLMQFGRVEIDRGRGRLTLTSSTRLVSWSTFWKTIMKERITVNRTFFISLFVDCVQSVFRRHKLGLGQEVLSEDDIFLDVECNIEMLQLNAHSFLRNELNSQSFVILLEKCFQEFISFGHAITGMGTIRQLASTRVVEFVDGSEQKVSGIDFIGLASELDIPEWNDETGLFSTNEHAAGKDSLSPEEMFLASSESGVYCLNGIVRWLLEENMLRSEGPFLENVKALTRRIVSMRFGELEGESWRKETEKWLCFQELVIGIVSEEIDPMDLSFLRNGCLASAFDLLEARTRIEQPSDLHFVEPESKGQSESDVETSSSNASGSLRTSLPSTQSTLPSDSSSEHATSLQDDMSREGDQIDLDIEDPSSTVLNFTFPDQSSPQNRQKLNLMRRKWIFDASSPHIVISQTPSLPSSLQLVTNTPLSHNPIILTEPIDEEAFMNDDSEVISTLENLSQTLFTHLAFLLNSDNPTLRTQSYMLVTLLASSPTHAPLLRHTRNAIRDSISDLTMESRLAFHTVSSTLLTVPSIIPHDVPSQNAAFQQIFEVGEQLSTMYPIPALKSLEEVPQFFTEMERYTKTETNPLTSIVKIIDSVSSEFEQVLSHFPPQFRVMIFINVMITCIAQKLPFPAILAKFYVNQSDPYLDLLAGNLSHFEKIHALLLRGFHVNLLSFNETHPDMMSDMLLDAFVTSSLFTNEEGRITLDIYKTHPPPQMSGFVNTAIDHYMSSTKDTLFGKWVIIDHILDNITFYTLTFGALPELRLLVLLFTHSPLKQFIWTTNDEIRFSMEVIVLLSSFGLPPFFDTPLLSLFPKDTEWAWATRADWAAIFSTPAIVKHILSHLSSPIPALVTATLELIKTATDLRSYVFNRILLSFDAAAHVMKTVESSLFLEDYENGCSILAMTLSSCQTKEQELLRNTFALFKKDSIQCLLDHLRGSEPIVTDENVGWFEDGFSEPFRSDFIPNRVVCLSTISDNCESMLVKHRVGRSIPQTSSTPPGSHVSDLRKRVGETSVGAREGVCTLLGRRETEEERDEDTSEADKDEESEEKTEQEPETESDETEQEPESVEYPRTVSIEKPHENPSTPTVFLHRVACLLISALFSTECDCLPSNCQPTESTSKANNDRDSTNGSVSEPNKRTLSESHLFRICLKLTGWFQTTFEKWRTRSVFTKTVRMDVESAVSLVFLLLPHADLSSQCFLVNLLRTFSHFTEMVPHVITPDLVRKVALFFARLSPSLPNEFVRSVEYGVRWMMAGKWPAQYGPFFEEAAELCRPILAELVGRLKSDVEGRREIAAQIWVIVSSNDTHLLYYSHPVNILLSVLSSTADDETAFFLFRACTKTVTELNMCFGTLVTILLQHSATILRFGKRIDDLQAVDEARNLFLQILRQMNGSHELVKKKEKTNLAELSKVLVMEFGEIVESVLQIREQSDHNFEREDDLVGLLSFVGSSFVKFSQLFDIDFSPLSLSLIPAVTPSHPFLRNAEVLIWVSGQTHYQNSITPFDTSNVFRFVQISPSFPTEQSVFEDMVNNKLVRAEVIIRFGKNHENAQNWGVDYAKRRLFKSVNSALRVKTALECAIRLPRLLRKSQHFLRAKQAQIEQGEEKNWQDELFDRVLKVFSTLNLDLITTIPQGIRPDSSNDIGFISWALTGGNRQDSLNPTSEDDSSQSEPCQSFFENLQFAAMWMLNGMVEFPFSFRARRGNYHLPIHWKMMLHSILFNTSFHPSIERTAIQMRVCLSEEGVEDVVGAVECLLDSSFRIKFWPTTSLPVKTVDPSFVDRFEDWKSLFG